MGPTPWPLFSMAAKFSVRSSCCRLWKPPWYVALQVKQAADKHVASVHSKSYMKLLMEISSKKYDASRNKIARKFNSICFNKGSSDSVVIPAGSVIEEAEKVAAVHRFDYGSFYPAEGAASHCSIREEALVEISEHMASFCSPCYVEEQARQEGAAKLQSCCRWRGSLLGSLLTVWNFLAMIEDEISEVTIPTSNQLFIQ